MRTIVATDLDGTVLFSEHSMGRGPDRPAATDLVEIDPYAYMTTTAVAHWTGLAGAGVLVPVTTRSQPQYARLRLPGAPPPLAIVCNGARLLVGGESDPAWERVVRHRIAGSAAPFATVLDRANTWRDERDFAAVRSVEDFFVYLTVQRREEWLTDFAAEADAWAQGRGWRVSLQGRKLYVLPAVLDKAAAVAEAATRLGAQRVIAGGDSLLDAEMLRSAHLAIRPAHGELHGTGFSAPHCRTTATRGAAAGDDILDWYATQVGQDLDTRRSQ
jgi:hydroxymethylpyrimidine pyrophosphatase-like HAD family hydrolase